LSGSRIALSLPIIIETPP